MIHLVPNIQILYSQLREQVQNQQPNYKNRYLSEKVIAGNTYLYLSCKIGTTLINTSLGREHARIVPVLASMPGGFRTES